MYRSCGPCILLRGVDTLNGRHASNSEGKGREVNHTKCCVCPSAVVSTCYILCCKRCRLFVKWYRADGARNNCSTGLSSLSKIEETPRILFASLDDRVHLVLYRNDSFRVSFCCVVVIALVPTGCCCYWSSPRKAASENVCTDTFDVKSAVSFFNGMSYQVRRE